MLRAGLVKGAGLTHKKLVSRTGLEDQAEAGQLKMKKPPRQAERLSCVLSECDVTHTPLRRATPSSSLQRLPMGCRGRSLVALLGELVPLLGLQLFPGWGDSTRRVYRFCFRFIRR